jgi:radical SAM protein with 4Fe4S-binding SPASM domain
MAIILNPQLIMRKDIDRVVIYSYESDRPGIIPSELQVPIKLHPNTAIIISLFNGKRESEDVAKIWSYLNDISIEESKNIVLKLIESWKELFIAPPTDYIHPYDPKDFVINAKEIDLSTPRCKIPVAMLFVPTLTCSQRCIYCYADVKEINEKDDLLPLSKVYEIIQECKKLEFASVSISGGEPFVYKNIFTILKWIREAGYHPQIPTKYPLTKKQVYRLKDIGFDSFQISIDTLDHRILTYITGMDNDYPLRIMKTMQYAKEAGLKLSIVSVVTTHNVNTIGDMVRKLINKGNIFRIRITEVGGSIYRSNDKLFPSDSDYGRLEDEINKIKMEFPEISIGFSHGKDHTLMSKEEKTNFFKNRPVCSAGKWGFVLLPNGKVNPCEELYYHPAFVVGDLRHQSIMEMWNSKEWHNLRHPEQSLFSKDSPCSDCEEFMECHTEKGRCWKRVLHAYAKSDFPDPYCPRAPIGNRIC